MERAVWAIFYHIAASDTNPTHDYCPPAPDTWCKYQRLKAEGKEKEYKHKKTLPDAVLPAIKPIFERLAGEELLTRCLGGLTQNNNESFNQLVWKICPKESPSGAVVVRIAAYLATIIFNHGHQYLLKVMTLLETLPGKRAVTGLRNKDSARVFYSNRAVQQSTKEARVANLRKRKAAEDEAQALESALFEDVVRIYEHGAH